MERQRTAAGKPTSPMLYLVAGFVLAVVFIGIALVVAMGGHMLGAGMMGETQGGGSWGPTVLVVALLAAGVLAAAWALLRGGLVRREASLPADMPVSASVPLPAPAAPSPPTPPPTASASELEAVALRLLDRDERLLFIEVKEKGGAALQKDIGQRDGFSRSKVTRLLDRLEAKGLIAREREGMTNRVRLLTRQGGAP